MRRFSYVLIVCSCLFLLTAGYYFSYQLGNSDQPEIQPPTTQETEQILQPSYLIRIVDGKVVIQHSDGSVYETTEISEESLPSSVREKIQKEYRLNSRQELYSFLENYSSKKNTGTFPYSAVQCYRILRLRKQVRICK